MLVIAKLLMRVLVWLGDALGAKPPSEERLQIMSIPGGSRKTNKLSLAVESSKPAL